MIAQEKPGKWDSLAVGGAALPVNEHRRPRNRPTGPYRIDVDLRRDVRRGRGDNLELDDLYAFGGQNQ
jgi:hypothetical protein